MTKSEQIADSGLFEGFEKSLSAVIGESAARAFIINANLSDDHFDPNQVSEALSRVFGKSASGLSVLQRKLLTKLSSTLNINAAESISNFPETMGKIAGEYRRTIALRYSLTGVAAAFVSSLCCLGPMTLLFLGVASAASALSLEGLLYSSYHVILVMAGLVCIATVVILQLRRDQQCNLTGLRKNLGYVLVPCAVLLVTYAVLNYLISIYFLGGFIPSMLYP